MIPALSTLCVIPRPFVPSGRVQTVTERFSTLLSSEGSEETKVLRAQMIVIPMLKQSASDEIFKDPSCRKLVESLLKLGIDSLSYGPKLTCELLQMVDILLERMPPEDMVDSRKDLLNFVWSVLKCDDVSTKYYAYLAVCRFISVFDTPSVRQRHLGQLSLFFMLCLQQSLSFAYQLSDALI